MGKTVAAVLVMTAVALAGDQKEPAPEVKPLPTERTFAASCDAVWPLGIQAFMSEGWSVKASDRAGGILTLEKTKSETLRKFSDFVTKYTTGKVKGFWVDWSDFRFAGGQAVMVPSGTGCSYTISIVFQGWGKTSAYGRTAWWDLTTNGYMEDKLLTAIEQKLPKKP